jgi:NAD+-dependent protein deacetylase sirtuin 2
MTGAGISVAAGIPDFRTKGTGLYDNLDKYKLPYAEAIFDISYFKQNPKPFCVLAKEMWPSNFEPTPCHYFSKILDQKGMLLRNYTQNIDTLESVCGMEPTKVIEAHGCFTNGHCIDCHKAFSKEFIKDTIFKDEIPKCEKCGGYVKPDITFFGEGLPERFHSTLPKDLSKVDFLIVIGTSLVVHPFAGIATRVPKNIPRVLINMEPAGPFSTDEKKRDVCLLGDCQVKILELLKELEWLEELKEMMTDSKILKESLEKLEKLEKKD